MAEWKPSKYVSAAIGWISLEVKKMETHYDLKKEYLKSESPQLPEWIRKLDFYLSYYKKQEAEK
jgi:hypothetical protein